ncbi:hypothetical protein [Lysobacter tyrosinilyticus]
MKKSATIAVLCLLLNAALIPLAAASEVPNGMSDEYRYIVSGRDPSPMTIEGAFGDQTDRRTGATEFAVADVSIPGNSSLEVSFRRNFKIEDKKGPGYLGGMGDWGVDVPYLYGTFSAENGWQVASSTPSNRCSAAINEAAPTGVSGFLASAFWHGYFVHFAGGQEEELLHVEGATPPRPTDGQAYYWLTKSLGYYSCVPLQAGSAGQGEGFLAHTPDGRKYYFNKMIIRSAGTVYQDPLPGCMTQRLIPIPPPTSGNNNSPVYHSPDDALSGLINVPCPPRLLDRNTVYLVATRVEDRFGNSVDYQYSGDQLIGIAANDGRQISIAYANGRVSSVTASGKTWFYDYQDGFLSQVRLPDGSAWKYLGGSIFDGAVVTKPEARLKIYSSFDFISPTFNGCRSGVPVGASFIYTVTSPSGAQAAFQFDLVTHGRTHVPKDCRPTTGTPGWLYYPDIYTIFGLTKKTISGPGLGTLAWTYSYYGRSSFKNFCLSFPASQTCIPTADVVEVDPAGTVTTFTYGNKFQENEGQLLRVKVEKDGVVARTSSFAYVQASDLVDTVNFPFADKVGESPQARDDGFLSELNRPQKATSIQQDGVEFKNTVNSFDEFARPKKVTRSSAPGG